MSGLSQEPWVTEVMYRESEITLFLQGDKRLSFLEPGDKLLDRT